MSDIEKIKIAIDYDPDTGLLKWKDANWSGKKQGWFCGTLSGGGYLKVMINGNRYAVHRIAWAVTHGYWPENDIDHIDGERTNNKIENLREATRSMNCRNAKKPKNNTSGFIGVGFCNRQKLWFAKIRVDGVLMNLGYFRSIEGAIQSRKNANAKYGFHKNHGR